MEVRDYVNLFEMARSDLEGVAEVVKSGNMDKAASMYISKAKARGLDAKKVVVGLGSTFRTYTDLSTDEIKELKDKIKEKLSGEMPEKKEKASPKKKAKKDDEEDEEEDKMDTKEKAAKSSTSSKKRAILLKKEKVEEPMPEETRGVRRMNIVDEILYRSGRFSDGQYMREQQLGSEGDPSGPGSRIKGKKNGSSMNKSSSGNTKTQMSFGTVNNAKGKASNRAENELDGQLNYEGLTKAMGTGEGGGAGGLDIDDIRHPAKGVGYTLGNRKGSEKLAYGRNDPNMAGGDGVSASRGKRASLGSRDYVDNEGLSGAPGLGDGQGDFGVRDDAIHPTRGVNYTLGKRAMGRGGAITSDPNANSGMKYTGRSEEGGGSKYTAGSDGRNANPESDPNTRSKGKYWKQGGK